MRHGPTLTAALWDPARGTAALHDAAAAAVRAVRAPLTVEDGAEDGLVQVHLWAGDAGLGLPEDDDTAWAALALSLGDVVRAVDPALALSAVEWGATSLLAPDFGELRPGLAAGRVRRAGLDDVRSGRFERLAARGVVIADGGGWAWAARGALPLSLTDGADGADGDRLSAAVFQAWWGRLPDEPAPAGPRIVVVARRPDVAFAGQVTAAAPDGCWCEPVAPEAVVVHPPEWDTAAGDPARLTELVADIAVLVDARWAGVGAGPAAAELLAVWLPRRPDALTAAGDVHVDDLPGGAGVVLRAAPERLRALVAADET